MIQKILTVSFYLLFSLTPLVWFPWNFELFEYNKMMLVYLLTIIIAASWILKMIQTKSLGFKRTPLDIPLLFFLLANILSTIFSMDTHTSIWGYYSRSNGGLLSFVSYLLLYWALVSNFDAKQVLKFLKAAILGGVLVSVWAIPEHFGISPSCVILTGNLNASCWIQDVQARVFATLGQPNWLAAYLAMLIFPALYFLMTSTKKSFLILNSSFLILFYLAFTFTYSRGATLGLLAGLAIFIIPQLLAFHPWGGKLNTAYWKPLAFALVAFFIISLIFGSALTDFKLLSRFAPPPRPSLTAASSTQLESGGTESGKIRLIVWKGALDIFKHYPVFGSGVETFAYSYYNFRPAEHNMVSEWDFLYNKAHNEFLNYLATTGIVGFGAYMAVILTFVVWSIKYYVLSIKQKSLNTLYLILNTSLLAAYVSYLIQNFFGFSVVIVALLFYLFPAILFVATGSTKPLILPKFLTLNSSFFILLYRRPLCTKLAKASVLVVSGLLIFTLTKYYIADTYFAEGTHASESGNSGKAYNELTAAVSLNPGEPYYRSELGFAAASAASVLIDQDSSTSASLKEKAIKETDKALQTSPNNVSFVRTAVRTYFMLSTIDKSFSDKTTQELDRAIALAPTDPKLTYNKAIILGQMGQNDEAIRVLEQTIKLKPNYRDAYYSLGLFLFEKGEKEKAKEEMKIVLKLIPNDPEALEKLQKWQ